VGRKMGMVAWIKTSQSQYRATVTVRYSYLGMLNHREEDGDNSLVEDNHSRVLSYSYLKILARGEEDGDDVVEEDDHEMVQSHCYLGILAGGEEDGEGSMEEDDQEPVLSNSYLGILAGWEEDGDGGVELDLLEPTVTLGYWQVGRKMGMVAWKKTTRNWSIWRLVRYFFHQSNSGLNAKLMQIS